ncbi:MAG: heparinase II/III family protein [Acidobacteriota bacterium]
MTGRRGIGPALALGLVLSAAAWPAPRGGAPDRVFPHPFISAAAADVPALKAATARLMEMPDGEIVRLIPELAPIRLVGCPNCQGGAQDTSLEVWTIEDPDHVRCRYCGERYPNERYPLNGVLEFVNPRGQRQSYRYYDGGSEKRRYFFEGVIAAQAGQYLAERAYDLALLYGATGEKAYAHKAAVILDRFAQVYPGWPVHGNVGNYANWKTFHDAPPYPAQSGKWGRWIHDEFMTELALAYDLIHESPAFAELGAAAGTDVRRRIENDLFRAQVELVRQYPRYIGASGQNGTAAGLIAIGRAIEEPECVHDGVARFRDAFAGWFHADGLLMSGSPAYTLQMLSALESPAQMAKGYSDPPGYVHPGDGLHFEGLDLGASSVALERSRAALRSLVLPDGRYAPVHDSWARKPYTQVQPPQESRAALLPATGHAVLGRGAGAEQAQVHLHFGDHAGHAHADELNLELFAHGREMLGEIGYSHTKLRPWAMSTLAHNTVVVDRFNQVITQGWLPVSWARLDRFEKTSFDPGENVFGSLLLYDTEDGKVQIAEAEAVRGYRGFVPGLKEYRRLVALVGISPADAYVVDVFRVTGGREHLWAAHGSVDQGQEIETSLTLQPREGTLLGPGTEYAAGRDPELDGESFKGAVYGLVDGLSSASADGAWSAAWRFADDPRLGLNLTMLGSPGRRVTVGRAPSVVPAGEDNAKVDGFKMPLLLVEDRNEESVFIAVWEPFRGRPRISAVRQLEFRGERGRSLGLTVEIGDRTDYILIDPDGNAMRETRDGGLSFQGRFGLVSEVKGKPLSMHLTGGTILAKGRLALRGRPLPEGKVVNIRRESGKEFFETEARLPEGGRLRNRWLLLRRPDGRTRAYRILDVRTSGDRSLILPEGGTGLESVPDPAGPRRTPGKFRDIYFPHSEFDGGLGSFTILDAAWTED